MGNIWLRNKRFVPSNAFNLMIHPLKHSYMWKYPQLWIINYWIWMIMLVILILICVYLFDF